MRKILALAALVSTVAGSAWAQDYEVNHGDSHPTGRWICSAQGYYFQNHQTLTVQGIPAATEERARSSALSACYGSQLLGCSIIACFEQ